MEGGNKSKIERKLESIEFDFSEKNWEAMEALLDEQDEKVTGMIAPKDSKGTNGFFKIFGIVTVLAIASLGSSSPADQLSTDKLDIATAPEKDQADYDVPPTLFDIDEEPKELTNKGISIEQRPTRKSPISISKLESNLLFISYRNELPLFKNPLQIIAQLPQIELNKLEEEPKLIELEQQAAKPKYHGFLTTHLLYNNSQLLPDYNLTGGLGFEILSKFGDRSSLTLGYHTSLYRKTKPNLEFSYTQSTVPEDETVDINQDSSGVFTASGDSNWQSSVFRQNLYEREVISSTPNKIFGHNFYINYFYQINNRWSVGTGAHLELVKITDFGNFSNSGVSLNTQMNMGKRFYLQLNNKIGIDRNSITPERNFNYNIGLKLGYQLF